MTKVDTFEITFALFTVNPFAYLKRMVSTFRMPIVTEIKGSTYMFVSWYGENQKSCKK